MADAGAPTGATMTAQEQVVLDAVLDFMDAHEGTRIAPVSDLVKRVIAALAPASASQEGDGQPEGWRERLGACEAKLRTEPRRHPYSALQDIYGGGTDVAYLAERLATDLRAALAAASQGGGGLTDDEVPGNVPMEAYVRARNAARANGTGEFTPADLDKAIAVAYDLGRAAPPAETGGSGLDAAEFDAAHKAVHDLYGSWPCAFVKQPDRCLIRKSILSAGPGGGLDREALARAVEAALVQLHPYAEVAQRGEVRGEAEAIVDALLPLLAAKPPARSANEPLEPPPGPEGEAVERVRAGHGELHYDDCRVWLRETTAGDEQITCTCTGVSDVAALLAARDGWEQRAFERFQAALAPEGIGPSEDCAWCGHDVADHRQVDASRYSMCSVGVSDGRDGGDFCSCGGGPLGDFLPPPETVEVGIADLRAVLGEVSTGPEYQRLVEAVGAAIGKIPPWLTDIPVSPYAPAPATREDGGDG